MSSASAPSSSSDAAFAPTGRESGSPEQHAAPASTGRERSAVSENSKAAVPPSRVEDTSSSAPAHAPTSGSNSRSAGAQRDPVGSTAAGAPSATGRGDFRGQTSSPMTSAAATTNIPGDIHGQP